MPHFSAQYDALPSVDNGHFENTGQSAPICSYLTLRIDVFASRFCIDRIESKGELMRSGEVLEEESIGGGVALLLSNGSASLVRTFSSEWV